MSSGLGFELNTIRFTNLLRSLIATAVDLQNNPPGLLVPKENLAISHVMTYLQEYVDEGILTAEHLVYDENQERGNLILSYKPTGWAVGGPTISFIGSHLDVVPGNQEEWEPGRDPFTLTIEGDRYYGRGTTDCLGHVALITDLFVQLADTKPALKYAIYAVFIASEEFSTPGIGIDALLADNKLDPMINGPVYWLDTSDRYPCIGCASAITWTMKANGLSGHSGIPDKAINPIEMGDEACKHIQTNFYTDYPPHESEEAYRFGVPSTMKPTQVVYSGGSSNQIPSWMELTGDVRLTPFYNADECVQYLKDQVATLNSDITVLPTRGPASKYEIDDPEGTGDKIKGELEITVGEPLKGIACNVKSKTFFYLNKATKEIVGNSEPFSLTGSLPFVGEMKDMGYDILLVGYGLELAYHKPNEYCLLSHMQEGMKILSRVIDLFQADETITKGQKK